MISWIGNSLSAESHYKGTVNMRDPRITAIVSVSVAESVLLFTDPAHRKVRNL
jgi:hypothetical protein